MAYASLVSLTNILDENIQLNLIPQNSQCIQTLLHEASFFQDFLDKTSYKNSKRVKCLETRMRDVAYKAQDIVDAHVANQILDESVSKDEGFTSLFQDLNEVMEEISSIKQEVMQMNEEDNDEEPGVQSAISLPAGSSSPPSIGTTTMIGLEDNLMEIKTRLLQNSSKLEIVSLVGMGGIGKTTLATKVYDDSYIAYHFDIRAWTTVSQQYNVRNTLLDLLGSEKTSAESNEQLEEKLYKCLKGRRFLIVLDDLWDTQVWDDLRRIFPNDKVGSRILLTTRLEKVAKQANSLHRVRVLKDEESWSLFCEKVFESGCCPLELECRFRRTLVLLRRDITFPHSIKKLTLEGCRSPWEDVTVVGSLPNLQVLKLEQESFIGEEWVPNEREFRSLKILHLEDLHLVHWRVEADHFPRLQHLFICSCKYLRKIPRTFAEIPTL